MSNPIVSVAAVAIALSSSTAEPSSAPDITAMLSVPYESKMISSGDNRPTIKLVEDHRQDILILLHQGVSPESIRSHFGWNPEDHEARLALLIENDFVRIDASGLYRPTSMVITLEDAETLAETARSVAADTRHIITNRIPEVRARYGELEAFQRIPFENASLLILSDVLLDNWQINQVEERFLKKARTKRHGANYYHSLQEARSDSEVESFGIYGNQVWGNEDLMIGVYGNKRQSSANLLSLDGDELARMFGLDRDLSLADMRVTIAREVILRARDSDHAIEAEIERGLKQLTIVEESALQVPVLSRASYSQLAEIAGIVTEDLIAALEAHRPRLVENYERSPYFAEISFEEYFIWWYHFFYTALTDLLARDGHVHVPPSGITTYIVELSE